MITKPNKSNEKYFIKYDPTRTSKIENVTIG